MPAFEIVRSHWVYALRVRIGCLIFLAALVGVDTSSGATDGSVAAPAERVGTAAQATQREAVPSSVLVVMNVRSADSRAIADRYVDTRHIPIENVLRIDCPDTDRWTGADYRTSLETFVQQRVRSNPAIDYIVLTRGIPFTFSDYGTDGGYSTDSILSTCVMTPRPNPHSPNPYFGADAHFSRERYGGLLLVTRLDGPTRESGLKEIESSIKAAPVRGPFYLRDSFIESMREANSLLLARGLKTEWVEGFNNADFPHYEGVGGPFMAHWGAGPHDTQFTEESYARMKFLPGAICDITWSTSAGGIRNLKSGGNIAVMTENGAAGAEGYVSEPMSDALSKAEIVLDRYTRGYNLAESFAMGTPYINWKQLVLGDPLCDPYANRTAGSEKPP